MYAMKFFFLAALDAISEIYTGPLTDSHNYYSNVYSVACFKQPWNWHGNNHVTTSEFITCLPWLLQPNGVV